MTEKTMQFQYGDRQLRLSVGSLLQAPVDVICFATDDKLNHSNEQAQIIISAGGDKVTHESAQLIRQYQSIDCGMAVFTSAGELPQEALIHVVVSEDPSDQQTLLERSIARSLMICDTNEWQSIAFEALGVKNASIALELCAQAFFRSIISFWDARHECVVDTILIMLDEVEFEVFFHAFRDESMQQNEGINTDDTEPQQTNIETAIVSLDELETELPGKDDEVNDWFK